MIEPEAIYTPSPDEILVINGQTPNGRTANWLLKVDAASWGPHGGGLTLIGRLEAARLNITTDLLRDHQKASINRLLAHLKLHCPQLLGEGTCDQIGGTGA